jgi:predicted nucleic acid-binding protein
MPTSYTVLDSGILLTTVQTERFTKRARELLRTLADQEGVEFAAPTLIRYELVAVTRKWVHRGLATPEAAQIILNTLLAYPITLFFDPALLQRGYELATMYNRPTAYDAQYLAVAERLSCDFWTADERLYNAVKDHFVHIHWIGEA